MGNPIDLRWCHGFQNVALLRIFEPRLRWSNPSGTGESASHAPTLKTTRLECAWLSVKRNSDRPRGKVKSQTYAPFSPVGDSRGLRSLTRSLTQGKVSLLRLNSKAPELSVTG